LVTVNELPTLMGTVTRDQVSAVAHEIAELLPVPLLDQVPGAFSLKVPSAALSVTFEPTAGQETMTLTVAVPAATVLSEAGFHLHSAMFAAVVEVAEPPVVNERPVPAPASVE
jgi:hypothetical protein